MTAVIDAAKPQKTQTYMGPRFGAGPENPGSAGNRHKMPNRTPPDATAGFAIRVRLSKREKLEGQEESGTVRLVRNPRHFRDSLKKSQKLRLKYRIGLHNRLSINNERR